LEDDEKFVCLSAFYGQIRHFLPPGSPKTDAGQGRKGMRLP